MDEVARLPAQDRADLFRSAARIRADMRPILIEKDFWVCWTLKRIFALTDPPAGLVFKGGTSLSKAYQAIDRFSEDVDLSFDRAALGFGGENDPAKAPSRQKESKRLESLSTACREMLQDRFLPQLSTAFAAGLGTTPSHETWRIELDPNDPDEQTLLFHYPVGIGERAGSLAKYQLPVVRLELGARGEQWPAEQATVTPYAAQAVPKPFQNPSCTVKALAPERTFWEKATILHVCYHRPSEKALPPRQSRHYYDVMKLYEKGIGKKALGNLDLLKSVVDHKTVFFRAAAAKYNEAVPGTLRLVPPTSRRKELEDDYAKMREMIFGEPPSMDAILAVVAEIERQVNARR
jgi:hypothetical protein